MPPKGWRTAKLPWEVCEVDPSDMPAQANGYHIPWDSVDAWEGGRQIAWDPAVLTEVEIKLRLASSDSETGDPGDFVEVQFKTANGVTISIVWARRSQIGLVHVRVPRSPGEQDQPTTAHELAAEVAQRFPGHRVQIDREALASFDPDACGPCTHDPADCNGVTCSFMRHMGLDPVTGGPLGRPFASIEYEDEELDQDALKLAGLLRRRSDLPEA